MTAVREIELSAPLAEIDDLRAYGRCMIVFRWHNQVVGREFVPVVDGRVPLAVLERQVSRAPGREALSRWLDETLKYDGREVLGRTPASSTVAICTRERPDELARALRAATAQRCAGHEILVVDNAPESGATRCVASRFPQVRYCCEPRRGLNAARNTALHAARGEIVAFTDDDAAPEPDWLGTLLRNFGQPQVACATGLTLPLELETEAQELFEDHCSFVRGFTRRVHDMFSTDPLAVGPVGAGASMAVRRDVVLDLGGFDERLDAGMPTKSGGDHEMFVRLLATGHRIVYDPAAVSWHCHRRSDQELLDTVFGYGVGVYAMWTGLLLERLELGVFKRAWAWFWEEQLPAALGLEKGLPGAARLARAELRGCLRGPTAWLAARRMRLNGG